MAAIKVNNLYIGYDGRAILQNISFTADKGILTILGPNGCGKSSLLHCISGIIKPIKGGIFINGKSISSLKIKTIAKELSIVTQDHHPSFAYSVEDMVLMGRTPYINTFNLPSSLDKDIAYETMEKVGISHLRKRPITELSGGERKLVLIGMAICQQTNIILLDEPTSFLDMKNSIIILNLIRKLANDENKTFIIAMHDINHAVLYADEALLIYSSNKFFKGKLDETITENNLSELYNVNFEIGKTKSNRKYIIPIL
jgi:iron complex transport system ATP-binding protein